MTGVVLKREGGGYVLLAEGHADYDRSGRDIVCAALSALIYSLAAELERMEDEGLLYPGAFAELKPGRAEMAFRPRLKGRKRAEGALGVFCRGLEMLSEEYPENVEFKEEEGERAA